MSAFTILLLAFASSAVWAQSPVVVSGQVTDSATGLPIEDATVSIGDQLRYTDAGGRYMLDPVPPASAAAGVEAKGYLNFQGDIEIAVDQAIHNFKLLRAATISGRISAPDAEWRRAGFVASLLQEDFTDGVRRFVFPTDPGRTERRSVSMIDGDGHFEFSGLAPGAIRIIFGDRARQRWKAGSREACGRGLCSDVLSRNARSRGRNSDNAFLG